MELMIRELISHVNLVDQNKESKSNSFPEKSLAIEELRLNRGTFKKFTQPNDFILEFVALNLLISHPIVTMLSVTTRISLREQLDANN